MKDLHVRLDPEDLEQINLLWEGKSMTEKISTCLKSKLLTKDKIEEQISFHKERIKVLEDMLKKNIFYDLANLPEEEMQFLLEAIGTIKKNPKYVYGQKEAYEHQFHKKMSISDFRVLMKEIQDGRK